MIDEGIIILFLCTAAIFDVKKRGIPTTCLFVWGVVETIYFISMSILERDVSFCIRGVIGLIPGVVCILISYISKEQIGYGDGCVILLIGFLAGYEMAIICFASALFLLSIVAAILLVIKKVTKKTRVAFVPFLFIGYIYSIICFR